MIGERRVTVEPRAQVAAEIGRALSDDGLTRHPGDWAVVQRETDGRVVVVACGTYAKMDACAMALCRFYGQPYARDGVQSPRRHMLHRLIGAAS